MSSNQLITAEKPNPVVTPALLCEIWLLRTLQCLSWDDIISRLRLRTVPAGYSCHAWKSGSIVIINFILKEKMVIVLFTGQKLDEEQHADKLRSFLVQLEFSYRVCEYDCQGVPFRSHLHVPEVHPLTGHTWYEREDPGHVLKV